MRNVKYARTPTATSTAGSSDEAREPLAPRAIAVERLSAASAGAAQPRAAARGDALGVGDDAARRDELRELLGDVHERVALGLGERAAVERVQELDRAEEAARAA